MRINGFRCDGCGKEHLLAPTMLLQGQEYRDVLPAEWFIVLRGGKWDYSQHPWTFCSKECLRHHPLNSPPNWNYQEE